MFNTNFSNVRNLNGLATKFKNTKSYAKLQYHGQGRLLYAMSCSSSQLDGKVHKKRLISMTTTAKMSQMTSFGVERLSFQNEEENSDQYRKLPVK